jgi:site-specific recombinase XerD
LPSFKDFQKASPQLIEILFKKLESISVLFNKALKMIAWNTKIKKNLSSHIARHSFADIARKKVSTCEGE